MVCGFCCFSSAELYSQQEWGYTQYLFNLYDINSAYAGNHHSASFSLRHRSQWIGITGAPSTQQLSMHAPLFQEKVGVGFKILNENIGARNQQIAKASAAYKLKLQEQTLSIGFAGGFVLQNIDKQKLSAFDEQDANLVNLNTRVLTPVIDVSVFYNTKKYYVGIESGRINRSAVSFAETSLSRLYYNITAVGGYMKKVRQNDMIQVSGLMKFSEGKIWQSELNVLYLANNKYWLGLGYRTFTTIQMLACINLNEHFRMGLSYDFSVGQMRKTNDGSGELFIGYNLRNRSGKSIRYF